MGRLQKRDMLGHLGVVTTFRSNSILRVGVKVRMGHRCVCVCVFVRVNVIVEWGIESVKFVRITYYLQELTGRIIENNKIIDIIILRTYETFTIIY